MFISSEFKGLRELTKRGITKKISVQVKEGGLADLVVDAKRREIKLVEGNDVYILTGVFGVKEESKINLFFVDRGVCIHLLCGKIYMRGDNGIVYAIDELGDISYPSAKDIGKVRWVDEVEARQFVSIKTKNVYRLSDADIVDYINNLAYEVVVKNTVRPNEYIPCFSFRTVEIYKDFWFENYVVSA